VKRGPSTIALGLAVGGGPAGLIVVLRALTETAAAQAAPRMERILWGAVAFGACIVVAGVVRLVRERRRPRSPAA
jgi:hypothetical protein